MKKLLILIFLKFSLNSILNAQFVFGGLPIENNNIQPILTSDLLKAIKWESLKQFCDTTEGHYAHEYKKGLLTEYEYVKQGRVIDFNVVSFQGKVVEFNNLVSIGSNEIYSEYFDKNVWLEYAHKQLSNLPDSLKLTIIENKKILKAYYQLLGVGIYDGYGWICEYSTVGRPTGRRIAVIDLLWRKELLSQLLDFPDIYVQLYVADALIYSDYRNRQLIEEHKSDKNFVEYLNEKLLTISEWKKIYDIRDSNQTVIVCLNGKGSYKGYESTTLEILNEKSIAEIPEKYNELKKMGYLQ